MDKKITPRFFSNLHLDRVNQGARRVSSIFRWYWANRVKAREGMAGVHYEREHYESEHCTLNEQRVRDLRKNFQRW